MAWNDDMPLQARPALTVTAVNDQVRGLLAPLPTMRVQGEVSRISISAGHYYFDLKDAGSKLSVRLWKTVVARLRHLPREGQQMVVTGRIDVWVPGGAYALIAQDLEPAGQGAQWLALQQLKEKLNAEGLFDPERKRALPFLPKTVALVTSPAAAGLADMLRILSQRCPVRVLVVPVKVQGEGAAASIAAGIELIDRLGWADVIIVGRGGGSAEDLWAFNEEVAVRAVAACRTPIVSAVGHEIDNLLTDLAADRRAPTPTAAAEMVVPLHADLQHWLAQWQRRATQTMQRQFASDRRHLQQVRARLGDGDAVTGMRAVQLDELQQRLARALVRQVEGQQRRLERLRSRLHIAHPLRKLAGQRRTLEAQHNRLLNAGRAMLERRRQWWQRRRDVLLILSPRAALGRGYAIVRREGGPAVVGVGGVQAGDQVEVLLRDGSFGAAVTVVKPQE